MPHLLKIRKGWQNEYLAEYILSKFCFVAKPTTIGEDVGTDFFCVLYKTIDEKYLQPKFSFAIQIKSNKRNVDISKNSNYYSKLEIPFFIGVVNQNENCIEIYSGEGIQHFFTLKGNPVEKKSRWYNPNNKIIFELISEEFDRSNLFYEVNSKYIIKLPYIGTLQSNSSIEEINNLTDEITKVSNLIQKNICGLKSGSYVYDFYNGQKIVYAGPSSNKTYIENFNYRLLEVFSNLNWKKSQGQDISEELSLFESIFLQIKKYFPNEKSIRFAESIYHELRKN